MGQEVNWLYLLVGAFAAGIASLVANLLVELYKVTGVRKNYILSLRLELQASVKALDTLKNSLEDRGLFAYRYIDVLDKTRERLEKLRTKAFLISKGTVHEKFAELVTDFAVYSTDIRALEDFSKFAPDSTKTKEENEKSEDFHRQFVEQKRQARLTELIDLKRRIDDILKEVSKN